WVTQEMIEEAKAHPIEPGPVHILPPPGENRQPKTAQAGSSGEAWTEAAPNYTTPNAGKDPTPHHGPLMRTACQGTVLVNSANEGPWGGAIIRFETDLNY